MKITRVTSFRREVPLKRPYTIARSTTTAVTISFVQIETDGPHVGLGCATAAPAVTGETAERCAAALAGNAPALLEGTDPRLLAPLSRRLAERLAEAPAARAALDMALHDLAGRALGVPVVDLHGRCHDSLPTSVTIGILPLDKTLAEADEHVANGFTHLKIKIGHDLDLDLERLQKLRARFGTRAALRADANEGYSPEQARDFLSRSRALDLEFLEQPVHRSRLAGLDGLPAAERRRLAIDESLQSEADALAQARHPAPPGVFVIKLMKCGGIAPALGIARIAELAGLSLMWGCMDESALSIAAALHAAFASPATRYLDLDGSFDLARDPARGGFAVERGRLRLVGGPGLGVTLCE